MKNIISWTISYLCLFLVLSSCQTRIKHEPLKFISSFIDSADHGIKILSLEMEPQKLETVYTLESQPTPAYFEFHPMRKYLYMLSSDPLPGAEKGGSVYAYRIDGVTERLEYINSVSSYGEGPCHIRFDHTGNYAFVANYYSGSFAVYPLREDGSIGDSIQFIQFTGSSVNPGRQEAPHAHSSLLSPDNRILYVADLGTDRIMVYDFDPATGKLTPAPNPWIKSAPGAGPRHMALHPKLDVLYVVEELSSSVGVYHTGAARDAGDSIMQRISTLPPD
ncbi:lactonase family protein, partial [Bacteroidota bacterium]